VRAQRRWRARVAQLACDARGPPPHSSLGLSTRGVRVVPGARTATVAAVFGADGDIAAAVADCALVEAELTPAWCALFRCVSDTMVRC
jgi:hypothetical protein